MGSDLSSPPIARRGQGSVPQRRGDRHRRDEGKPLETIGRPVRVVVTAMNALFGLADDVPRLPWGVGRRRVRAAFAGNLMQPYDRQRIVQGAHAGLRPPGFAGRASKTRPALRAISGGLEAVATGPAPRQAAKSPVGASSGCPFDTKSSPPFQDRGGQAACCSSPILPLLAHCRSADFETAYLQEGARDWCRRACFCSRRLSGLGVAVGSDAEIDLRFWRCVSHRLPSGRQGRGRSAAAGPATSIPASSAPASAAHSLVIDSQLPAAGRRAAIRDGGRRWPATQGRCLSPGRS